MSFQCGALIELLDEDYPALKSVQNLNFTLLIETWPSFSSRLKPALNWNWPFPGPSGRWSGGEGKRCRGFGQIGLEGTSVVIFKRIFLPGFSKRLDLKLVIWAGFPGFDQIGLKRTSVGIFKCISGSNQYLCLISVKNWPQLNNWIWSGWEEMQRFHQIVLKSTLGDNFKRISQSDQHLCVSVKDLL